MDADKPREVTLDDPQTALKATEPIDAGRVRPEAVLQGTAPEASPGGVPATSTPPPAGPLIDKSLGSLVMEITQDFSKLMRKEVELAKQETTEMVRTKLMAAGLGVVGAVLGLFLVPFVLFTVYQILAVWVANWIAALIVTLLTAAGCGGAFLAAKAKFEGKLKPERTIRTLKKDVQWAKHLKK